MFVRNPNALKRPIIKVNKEVKEILQDCGFSPISMEDGKWIFLRTDEIVSLIFDIDMNNTMGGVSHER